MTFADNYCPVLEMWDFHTTKSFRFYCRIVHLLLLYIKSLRLFTITLIAKYVIVFNLYLKAACGYPANMTRSSNFGSTLGQRRTMAQH